MGVKIMSTTKQNLRHAFAGESQANRKYLAFAKKADDEGYPQVARLFRAVAEAETVHALYHLRVLGAIGTTDENLRAAVSGEHYEFESMYPGFIADAEAEGEKGALRSFSMANDVEKVHARLFEAALEDLAKEVEEGEYYVCPVCGYTQFRSAPDKCPVCGAPASRFTKIS